MRFKVAAGPLGSVEGGLNERSPLVKLEDCAILQDFDSPADGIVPQWTHVRRHRRSVRMSSTLSEPFGECLDDPAR